MRYVTDLFDTLWGDKLEDRTDEVKAEKVRLSLGRRSPFAPKMATKTGPTAAESQKASETYSNARRAL